MAVASTSASKTDEEKQTKGNGEIRAVGGGNVDSETGKTCHQCRQKTKGFLAQCKRLKKEKQCLIKYCRKCLLNRYGENAEEVALLFDWECPKCRDICNCSLCMKKKGHKPTGILVHTAKATGYSSVSELLQAKGPEEYEKIVKDVGVLPKKHLASKKESVAASPRKLGKENSFVGDFDSKVDSQNLTSISNENKSKKMKREGLKELCNGNEDHEASLKRNSPKKPKVLNEASKKKVKGNKKNSGCVSDNNSRTDVQMDDPSSSSKGEETKCAKSKREGVLNGVKIPEEISKRRKPTISDEQSKKKLKSKEKSEGDILEEKNSKMQVPESNAKSLVRNEKNGVKSVDPGCLHGVENDNTAELKLDIKPRKNKKFTTHVCDKKFDIDTQLPQGTSSITVAGFDLPPQDVGHALQFLEFCAAFGEVLDMKKGQAESVIREIVRGRGKCRLQYSPAVHIHIQLLSLIQKDMGKKFPSLRTNDNTSWFRALGECVSESHCALEEAPSNFFDNGVNAYDLLDSCRKLKLLNFLCDEALNTTTLRSWIDKQNLEFVDSEKEAKEKILAARDKEKQLKQKMQDEVGKFTIERSSALMSVSEHETLVGQIKREAVQAHADVLQAMSMLPKKRQRSDAVRTAPIALDVNGHAFWRLRGYTRKNYILLQDIGTLDPVAPDEKWFAYGVEQKADVEKYISFMRTKRVRIQEVSNSLPIVKC